MTWGRGLWRHVSALVNTCDAGVTSATTQVVKSWCQSPTCLKRFICFDLFSCLDSDSTAKLIKLAQICQHMLQHHPVWQYRCSLLPRWAIWTLQHLFEILTYVSIRDVDYYLSWDTSRHIFSSIRKWPGRGFGTWIISVYMNYKPPPPFVNSITTSILPELQHRSHSQFWFIFFFSDLSEPPLGLSNGPYPLHSTSPRVWILRNSPQPLFSALCFLAAGF